MEKSHGGDKNNGFALTAHFIRTRLHLLDGGYNFDGIHLKNFLKKHNPTAIQSQL
jgi:hypothetical protein